MNLFPKLTHPDIHETIQPVVQKEVIEPSVVHTTIPVHEIHHKSVVEDTTSLPTLSMAEYKSQGGPLTGSERRRDSFEGPPEHLGKALDSGNDLGTIGGRGAEGTTSLTGDLEPKVGPNRGNTPATNAQRNVAEREANTTGMTGTTGTTGMTTTTETTGTTGTTGTIGSDTTSSTLDGTGHETPVNTNYDNVYTKPGDSNTVDHETTTPVKKEGLLSKIKHALE